ncbi:hypothetical protein L914_11635 [Phytophthora nicotianae]|uniref:Uncharacterized protein n=1 Tax=Phytophthora nicotianae TaxID=4792 RepID=W2N4J8_PHYNI|nr:hypothetical protein L914_11635 [Phytophthora nicotianae]
MVFGWRMSIDRERLEDDHPEKRGSRGVINVQNTGLKPVLAAAKASSMHGVLCHPTRIPSREHCVQPALSQSRTGINECCEDWRSESASTLLVRNAASRWISPMVDTVSTIRRAVDSAPPGIKMPIL